MGLFSNLVKLFLALRKDEPKLLAVIAEGQQIVGDVRGVVNDVHSSTQEPKAESK